MYYYKHQYSNDLWPLKIKRNCILLINRSKLLIKLIIKNAVGLILDNFGIVGFLFFSPIPVDSSHFSLHFDNILSPKAPIYFILNVLKRSLILAYGPTGSDGRYYRKSIEIIDTYKSIDTFDTRKKYR